MSARSANIVVSQLAKKLGMTTKVVQAMIVDATFSLKFKPLPCDVKGAKPRDPFDCIHVHAGMREWKKYKVEAVVFWKTAAYVCMTWKGVRGIYRLMVPYGARKIMAGFDRGQPLLLGDGFELTAPKKGERLGDKCAERRRWNRSPAGKAFYRVNSAQRQVRSAEKKIEQAVNLQAEASRTNKPSSVRVSEAKRQTRAAHATLREKKVNLESARKAAREFKPEGRKQSNETVKWDLSMRNGAVGNYNFVSA